MARRAEVGFDIIRLDRERGPVSRVRQVLKDAESFPKPDFVMGTGHGTHLSLLLLARKFDARSVVLMKPGLPMGWFDWCVIPEHDFSQPLERAGVILSKGALNRVVPAGGEKSGNLVLVGGPSKHHGYDEEQLIRQIRNLTSEGSWEVVDSRRTPAGFREALKREVPEARLIRHEETESGWLAGRLASASEVWVSEDSVSMIYEALTGGARVGVLEMPRLKADARVVRGLEILKAEGFFAADKPGRDHPPGLAEADRCAEIILSQT